MANYNQSWPCDCNQEKRTSKTCSFVFRVLQPVQQQLGGDLTTWWNWNSTCSHVGCRRCRGIYVIIESISDALNLNENYAKTMGSWCTCYFRALPSSSLRWVNSLCAHPLQSAICGFLCEPRDLSCTVGNNKRKNIQPLSFSHSTSKQSSEGVTMTWLKNLEEQVVFSQGYFLHWNQIKGWDTHQVLLLLPIPQTIIKKERREREASSSWSSCQLTFFNMW